MVSHLQQTKQMPRDVRFIYASRMHAPNGKILFLSRLQAISTELSPGQFVLQLYLTGGAEHNPLGLEEDARIIVRKRRISHSDLLDALGGVEDRSRVVCYVCGPPAMTDDFVTFLGNAEGMSKERVLCEKWW